MSSVTTATNLWRNGDFLRFWFGETVSLVGTQITALALPLTAIHYFGASDGQVGLLRFLQLAPYLGLALIYGSLAVTAPFRAASSRRTGT